MKKYLLFTVALIGLPFTQANAQELVWEPLGEKLGVTVARAEVPASGIFAARGEGEFDVHIARIFELFRTMSRQTEWVDRLVETRIISEADPNRPRYYARYGSPWPISDRDFVFQRDLTVEEDKRRITVVIRSVVDEAFGDQDCCVRGWTSRAFWRFTSRGENKTFVEVEIITDPKGWIPNWLINLVQRNWPVKTITALMAGASQPDSQKAAEYATW